MVGPPLRAEEPDFDERQQQVKGSVVRCANGRVAGRVEDGSQVRHIERVANRRSKEIQVVVCNRKAVESWAVQEESNAEEGQRAHDGDSQGRVV